MRRLAVAMIAIIILISGCTLFDYIKPKAEIEIRLIGEKKTEIKINGLDNEGIKKIELYEGKELQATYKEAEITDTIDVGVDRYLEYVKGVRVKIYDNAGNWTEKEYERETGAPTGTITVKGISSTKAEVQINVVDESGVALIELYNDTTYIGKYEGEENVIDTVTVSEYKLNCEVIDGQGNVGKIEWTNNNPPNVPIITSGPTSGGRNKDYIFTSSATDPNGNSVSIRYAWGDGDTSDWKAGAIVTDTHAFAESGTFYVKAQAKDSYGALSGWSSGKNIIISNNAPSTPTTPSGNSTGIKNVTYNFTSSSTDGNGDNIAIRFAWGDGDTSTWSGYYASGTTITSGHIYTTDDTFTIKAQAKDSYGALSGWSSGKNIIINTKPIATTLTADSITYNSAKLRGTVNPNGLSTTYYFQWDTTTNYNHTTTTTPAGSGTSAVSVSFNLTGLTAGKTYHYRIVATNSAGTTPGNDVTFTTGTLPTVTLSSPANNATGVSLTPTLTWTATNATSYDVYFGTSSTPPLVASNVTSLSYTTGTLTAGTPYYWKIVAKNAYGSTPSTIWKFTTGTLPTVTLSSPANNATGVSLTPTLTWTATNATSYDVYFGTTSTPPLVASNVTSLSYTTGTLTSGTPYYWKIVAKNAYGSTPSTTWHFTTRNLLSEVGYYDTPGDARGVYVSGSYAYVADYDGGGLRVIDISNPSSPTEAGYYDTPGAAANVYVSGNYAYVADDDYGLRIINIFNPASPTEVGYYDTPSYAYGVYVSGSYAYVADGGAGLRIINISNPASPTEVGYYDTPDYAMDVYVSGSYAYVADGYEGLRIIDITNPSSPTEAGYYDTPVYAEGVYVSGSYAYVADYDYGLRIIDISNPASPTEAGYYDTPGNAWDVYVSGSYAYVADSDGGGLRVIDISNPSSPTEVGYYDTPGWASDVYVSGSYAYVADGDYGLRVIYFEP